MCPALDIRPYTAADDAQARELERRMVQGDGFVRSFRRTTFASRAQTFDEHEILVACDGSELVGLVAVGLKDVQVHGAWERAAFYFDLRVHPDHRRKGVAQQLNQAIASLTRDRASLRYSYVMDDAGAAQAMAGLYGVEPIGAYQYLVASTALDAPVGATVRPATLAEVHQSNLRARPPFDFYSDPQVGGRLDGHVGSWLVEDDDDLAGCSAWDNHTVVSEVVEGLPGGMAALSRLAHWGPLARLRLPSFPQAGEALRSWYLFDVHATTQSLARSLLRHALTEARMAGIDCCSFILESGDPLLDVFRAELPSYFAPEIRYHLYARRDAGVLPPVGHLYVDIRDI